MVSQGAGAGQELLAVSGTCARRQPSQPRGWAGPGASPEVHVKPQPSSTFTLISCLLGITAAQGAFPCVCLFPPTCQWRMAGWRASGCWEGGGGEWASGCREGGGGELGAGLWGPHHPPGCLQGGPGRGTCFLFHVRRPRLGEGALGTLCVLSLELGADGAPGPQPPGSRSEGHRNRPTGEKIGA